MKTIEFIIKKEMQIGIKSATLYYVLQIKIGGSVIDFEYFNTFEEATVVMSELKNIIYDKV